ncbi:MAG: RNA methyltransferase [Rhodospirillaceae bacterium]|nr:RNA methyltransferase [Rhodospirillaceae bacterium]
MAFDPDLARRVREALATQGAFEEKRMFGGVAFMRRGNMVCGVLGESLILRLGEEGAARAVADRGVALFAGAGRPMRTMVQVPAEKLGTSEDLVRWLDAAVAFTETLPAKS